MYQKGCGSVCYKLLRYIWHLAGNMNVVSQ